MKRLISLALIMVSLSIAVPASARWVCLTTNAHRNVMWYWHGPTFSLARDRALNACAGSLATLDPSTCHLVTCHPSFFAPGVVGPVGPVGPVVGVGYY